MHESYTTMRAKFTNLTFNLAEALDLYSAEDIQRIGKWLAVPTPRPTRKAQMIAFIESQLTGSSLEKLWNGLDQIEQLAVREAVHGDFHRVFKDQFQAKYGKFPEGCDVYTGKNLRMPIRLFLYIRGYVGDGVLTVPEDLASRLHELAKPPNVPEIQSVEELPDAVNRPGKHYSSHEHKQTFVSEALTRLDMDRVAAQELKTVLQLIDLGRVSVSAKTRLPSAKTRLQINELLVDGDFYDLNEVVEDWQEQVGSIRAFAWPLLVQAGKLAELRGTKLALTKKGYNALAEPATETLRELWNRWVNTTIFDEFSRIDNIKGQTRGRGKRSLTAPPPRREIIIEALSRCPAERWISFDDFSKFMRASGLYFNVTENEWSLYIGEPEYGSLGYDGSGGWHIVQARYLLCLLFEYAATLGLIDVAYTHPRNARPDFDSQWGSDDLLFLSRYDGLAYFRLNTLGAYFLGLRPSYEPPSISNSTKITIFPDLRLQTNGIPTHEERLLLETFTHPESEGIWRLTLDKTLSAIENGQNIQNLEDFLTTRDDQPLPETVEGFLLKAKHAGQALKQRGSALLIECSNEDIATELSTNPHTSKLCLRAGNSHVVVRLKNEKAFRKAARELGYALPRL